MLFVMVVIVVSVSASIRVAVKISTNLFNYMFFGSICGFCNGSSGSDISQFVIVLVVMVRY